MAKVLQDFPKQTKQTKKMNALSQLLWTLGNLWFPEAPHPTNGHINQYHLSISQAQSLG